MSDYVEVFKIIIVKSIGTIYFINYTSSFWKTLRLDSSHTCSPSSFPVCTVGGQDSFLSPHPNPSIPSSRNPRFILSPWLALSWSPNMNVSLVSFGLDSSMWYDLASCPVACFWTSFVCRNCYDTCSQNVIPAFSILTACHRWKEHN